MKKIFTSLSVRLLLALSVMMIPTGCGIYSFSGVSIAPSIKTIQVDVFPNNAPLINPILSSYFTSQLQDMYSQRTNLTQVKNNGDLIVEGEIVQYDQTSVAAVINPTTGKATAAKVRLTIGVKVRFYNNQDEEQNFEKSFSNYQDIDGNETLSGAQEQQLVEEIVDVIINQIFTETVAQW
ncbi:MAG: LptE family protein [Flavobacteriales bacterium]|nr:LptE family protein [Flavobacteriales bacterium]